MFQSKSSTPKPAVTAGFLHACICSVLFLLHRQSFVTGLMTGTICLNSSFGHNLHEKKAEGWTVRGSFL